MMVLTWSGPIAADQAQYIYDALGRLVGVIDGNGDLATYHYDPVGNLLEIRRFAAGGSGAQGVDIGLVSPGQGFPGTEVTIGGTGFSATSSENQVTFNGVSANVLTATPTTLVAVVPVDATTGLISVTNANGTASSPQPFKVPRITAIEPSDVLVGTTVEATIQGNNLTGTAGVFFPDNGGVTATLLEEDSSGNHLVVRLTVNPAGPVGRHEFSLVAPAGVISSGSVALQVLPPNFQQVVAILPQTISPMVAVLNNRHPTLDPTGQPPPAPAMIQQAASPSLSILNNRHPTLDPAGQPPPVPAITRQAVSPTISILNQE